MRFRCLVAALCCACGLAESIDAGRAEPAPGVRLYVSPAGTDAWSGRLPAPDEARAEGPLATLEGARDRIREMKKAGPLPAGGVTVHVRAGVYPLARPLQLAAADSGSPEAPVVYRAFEGEKPVLTGGRPITGFTRYQGQILRADVGAQGLRDVPFKTLVFAGKRQEPARYPNRDPLDPNGGAWAHVDGKRTSMYADSPDEGGYHQENRHLDFWQRNLPRLRRELRMKPGDARGWQHPEDAEVSIFPRFNWTHNLLAVEAFDPKERLLKLGPGSFYEIRAGDRYFLRGPLEELDAPGEWHLDRRTWTLYWWPPEPIRGRPAYAPVVQSIVTLEGCSHVTFRGFTMECCEGTAVTLKGCEHVLVAGSTIRDAGGFDGCGVAVAGGHDNRVVGNDIYDVGCHGISLGGGDPVSLTPGGNVADNNTIHHVGRVGRHGKGVALSGALNRVSHNLIYDIPHSGVMMWGPGHTIEYNRFRHTCLESEDTAAIGGGAIDWLSWQGAVIRYNWIQDTLGYGYDAEAGEWRSPHFAYALYPDWAASGVRIVGNVLVRAPRGCLHLHSGRDNVIENNILVDGGQSQVDWSGWTTATGFWSTRVESWIRTYEAASKHEAWRTIPTLQDPRKVPLPDARVMRGNIFRRNIIAYRTAGAALLRFREVPLKENESDRNLVWATGQPIRTGFLGLKAERGPNLLANPGLEEGPAGGFPEGWAWMTKATEETRAAVVEGDAHTGTRCLLVEPGEAGAGAAMLAYVAPGPAAPFQPGRAYRFSAWLKAEGKPVSVRLDAYSWKENAHNWLVSAPVEATREWRQVELILRLPKPGDAAYRPTMETRAVRLAYTAGPGRFRVDDVSLREAEATDEWGAWQAQGMDRHSVVADPLFVDPEGDDYRLRPGSPALKLGFEPIPFDRIGPYESELRASWPIVEAPGAREALRRAAGRR